MTLLRPTKIVCVGKNYLDHAREMGSEVPPEPLLFFKPPSAIIGPGDAIVLPPQSAQVEHEAEIGVVIGSRLRDASEQDAERAIAGFVCVNDVTARDLQRKDHQWARAKGFDTFCPVGPRVANGLRWNALEVVGRVNGVVRQRGKAGNMAYGIPFLLAYISRIMTLEPGDLIATGTPAGVGRLEPGDVVEVEVSGVGVLSNPVVSSTQNRFQ